MEYRLIHLTFGAADDLPPLLRESASEGEEGMETAVLCLRREGRPAPRDTEHLHFRFLDGLVRRISLRQASPLKLLRYAEFFLRACAFLASHRARTIVAHDLPALPPAFVAGKLFSRRILYHAHELWMDHAAAALPLPLLWRGIERLLAPRVDAVVTPDEERAEIYRTELRLRELPFIVRNLPASSIASAAAERENEKGKDRSGAVRLIYQGLIDSSRCLLELIDAAALLPPDIRCTLIGGGDPEYRRRLEERIRAAGLEERVEILPRVPYASLASLTAAADIGVLLYRNDSRNNYFCAPNKLYEYMHAGLAIVASDFPVLRREVAGAGIGACVLPADPEDIARGIRLIASSRDTLAAMGRRARDRARGACTWEEEYRRLREFHRARGFV